MYDNITDTYTLTGTVRFESVSSVWGVPLSKVPKKKPQDPGFAKFSRYWWSENCLTVHRQTALFDPLCLEKWIKPGSCGLFFST
jgi:hypothetical protein